MLETDPSQDHMISASTIIGILIQGFWLLQYEIKSSLLEPPIFAYFWEPRSTAVTIDYKKDVRCKLPTEGSNRGGSTIILRKSVKTL